MLSIPGKELGGFCDGLTRRSFLKIGGLALGGMSLPDILKAEEKTGRNHKAVIMIFLAGGPPHQDMWDLKTEAPSEIRGEFRPIKTNVSGMEFCELFPQMAKIADKLAVIRSIVGAKDRHEAFQCLTGRLNDRPPTGGWPCIGSIVSKIQGVANHAVPASIGLSPRTQHKP